jgi:copper chaperone NosL
MAATALACATQALRGATLATLVACGLSEHEPLEPVPLHFGEDECAHCKMLVGDDRQAAEVVTKSGTATIYDDVGCLLSREAPKHPDPKTVFVRAFDGSGWVRGDVAVVLRSTEIASPMGYGFAAFGTRDRADAEARRHSDASVSPLATLLRAGIPPSLPSRRDEHANHAPQGEIQP